jgi:general secretion pathway protein M
MSAESPRGVRRWAVAAAAVALPLAALALTTLNVLEAADKTAVAERQEAALGPLERRVGDLGALVAKPRDAAAIYLPGETPALARAELQRRLGAAVEAAGGRLIETQDPGEERAEDAPADGRVELRVTFDARNDSLLSLLHAIETGLPLLSVERIEARRLDSGEDADPEDPTLRIGLVVRGHRKLST